MPEAARRLGELGPEVGRRKVTPKPTANGDLSEAVLSDMFWSVRKQMAKMTL